MNSEQLHDLERLRQLWLTDPIPNCSAYITALEHALLQHLPQPGFGEYNPPLLDLSPLDDETREDADDGG